jgi:hypothetical protein
MVRFVWFVVRLICSLSLGVPLITSLAFWRQSTKTVGTTPSLHVASLKAAHNNLEKFLTRASCNCSKTKLHDFARKPNCSFQLKAEEIYVV